MIRQALFLLESDHRRPQNYCILPLDSGTEVRNPYCLNDPFPMHHKLTVLICFLFATGLLQAQVARTNHWHFGFGMALDFSSGAPVQVAGSQQFTFEGCAALSNTAGQLLWYTNGGGRDPVQSGQPGGSIWDRNNDVLYDMSYTEGGGYSSAQSAVFITKPGAPNEYYLFTMEEVEYNIGGDVPSQPGGRGLSWFALDATLNGGLGGVTDYQENIYGPTYEGLCAIQHTNGVDWWIVAFQSNLKGLVLVPVTSAGVGQPLLIQTPALNNNVIKSSPDGKWLTTIGDAGRLVFPFDAATGTLTNPVILPAGMQVEFSANSRWLYAFSKALATEVYRFDLESPDIPGSQFTMGTIPDMKDGLPLMTIITYPQLGPDRNIYFSNFYLHSDGSTASYLSAIICANTGGTLAPNHFFLGDIDVSNPVFLGLPNFPAAWLAGETIEEVNVDLGPDTTLCQGASIHISFPVPGASYLWSTGDTTTALVVTSPGTYHLTVTTPCASGVDTIIIYPSSLIADAGPDITICAGDSTQIGVDALGNISWSPSTTLNDPGSVTPVAFPDSTTTYILEVSGEGCVLKDSMLLTVFPLPDISMSPIDTTVGPGSPVLVSATGGPVTGWTPPTVVDCLTCNETEVTVFETTRIIVEITGPNGCSALDSMLITIDLEICKPRLPNVFTPNGDQVNGLLAPVLWDTPYRLQVWNRWGKLIFDNNGDGSGWDGKADGADAPSDVYAWMFTANFCGREQTLRGEITLVR